MTEWVRRDTWPRSETEQLERQAGVMRGLFVWTFWTAFNGTLLILKFIQSWDAAIGVFEGPLLLVTHRNTKVLCLPPPPKKIHYVPAVFSAHRRVVVTGKFGRGGYK